MFWFPSDILTEIKKYIFRVLRFGDTENETVRSLCALLWYLSQMMNAITDKALTVSTNGIINISSLQEKKGH